MLPSPVAVYESFSCPHYWSAVDRDKAHKETLSLAGPEKMGIVWQMPLTRQVFIPRCSREGTVETASDLKYVDNEGGALPFTMIATTPPKLCPVSRRKGK